MNIRKWAPEVLAGIAIIVVPLSFIQILHIAQHKDHCKTHHEWVQTLDEDIRSLVTK